MTLLQNSMLSPAGMLLDRALDLQFACEHFSMDLDQVPADEYFAFKVLKAEINRYEREQIQKDTHKHAPTAPAAHH